MVIKTSYHAPISVLFLMTVATMMLISSATGQLRSSSAYNFDPDYPVGTPPIQGGTGYVTEVTDGDGWHTDGTAIGFGQQCTEVAACKDAGVYGLYHPGEDWNYGSGTDDVDEPVYAIAYGTVFDTRDALFGDKSGYGSGIVIEHTLPSGEKIYSVYEHIDTSLSKGDPVYQGQRIGSIADITKLSPHLHFEIRTTLDKKDWYRNDEGRAYYSSEEKIYTDGFIDPSVFLDFHRGSLPAAVAAIMVGLPRFGLPGFGLPSTDAAVAPPKTGLPGFGTPLLPPPTSGMLSGESNEGPGVQSASPNTQGTHNGIVGRWTVSWVMPGSTLVDETSVFDVIFNVDGTLNIPEQYRKELDGSETLMPAGTGRWTQNEESVNWNFVQAIGNTPTTPTYPTTPAGIFLITLTGTIHGNRMENSIIGWDAWSAKRISSDVAGASIAGVGPLIDEGQNGGGGW